MCSWDKTNHEQRRSWCSSSAFIKRVHLPCNKSGYDTSIGGRSGTSLTARRRPDTRPSRSSSMSQGYLHFSRTQHSSRMPRRMRTEKAHRLPMPSNVPWLLQASAAEPKHQAETAVAAQHPLVAVAAAAVAVSAQWRSQDALGISRKLEQLRWRELGPADRIKP